MNIPNLKYAPGDKVRYQRHDCVIYSVRIDWHEDDADVEYCLWCDEIEDYYNDVNWTELEN